MARGASIRVDRFGQPITPAENRVILPKPSLDELHDAQNSLSTLQESIQFEADLVKAAIEGKPVDVIRLAYYIHTHDDDELHMSSPNQIDLLKGLASQNVPEAKGHLADMLGQLGVDDAVTLALESPECSLSRYQLGLNAIYTETKGGFSLPSIETFKIAFEHLKTGVEIGPSQFTKALANTGIDIPDGAELCAEVLSNELSALLDALATAESSGNTDQFLIAALGQNSTEEYQEFALEAFNLIENLKLEHPKYANNLSFAENEKNNEYLAELTRQV